MPIGHKNPCRLPCRGKNSCQQGMISIECARTESDRDADPSWPAGCQTHRVLPGKAPRRRERKFPAVNRQHGFSLIEILIVVSVLLIIAAIATPRLLRARISANEASAVASLKQIGTANAAYLGLYQVGYAGTLVQLGPPGGGCATVSSACADMLDSLLAGVNPATSTPVKSGYRFTYSAPNAAPTPTTPNTTFSLVATPFSPQSSGQSTFCFDNTSTIFKDSAGGLTSATPSGCASTWPVGGTVGPL